MHCARKESAMVPKHLSDMLLAKYANADKPTVVIRPMARNAAEIRMLLEGTSAPESSSVQPKQGPVLITRDHAASILCVKRSLLRYHIGTGRIASEGGLVLLASVEEFKKLRLENKHKARGFSLSREQEEEVSWIFSDPSFKYSGKKGKSLVQAAEEFGISMKVLRRASTAAGVAPESNYKGWSDAELEKLAFLAERYLPSNVAQKMQEAGFNRSYHSITKKMSILGLGIIPAIAEEFTVNMLAERLNVGRGRIYSIAKGYYVGDGGRQSISRKDAMEIVRILGKEDCGVFDAQPEGDAQLAVS